MIMNKLTMFIWGLIIFMMFGIILVIGYKKQDKVFLELSASLEGATKRYIENKKIDLKFNESSKIYLEDLINEEYIEYDKDMDKYCIDSVIVTKGLLRNDYKIDTDCKDKE